MSKRSSKYDIQSGSNWTFPRPIEIIKCKEGNREYMKERRARRPFGHTTLVCEFPITPEEFGEPGGNMTTWRLAKRAARDFLRVSVLPSAIVTVTATHNVDYEVVIRVYGKY